jgi:hypothetical protein
VNDRDIAEAVERARQLVEFSHGLADGGHPETARRCRVVARELIEIAAELELERSHRMAMQAARDRLLEVLERRGASNPFISDDGSAA